MLRLFLVCFSVCLAALTGCIYQARQAPFQEFMLVQSGARGAEQIIVLDPATNTQRALTDTYDEVALNLERDGWLYFWGENDLNHETFYRRHVRQNIQQAIVTDALSRALVNIILAEKKVVYVRKSGELAVVNLDGTANQNIALPEDIHVLEEAYASFGFAHETRVFNFAAQQGENTDIFQVYLDGQGLQNLTEALPDPHRCINYYWFSDLHIFYCDDIYYYRPATDSDFVELLPSTVSVDQRLMGIEGDTVKTIYLIDGNSTQMYLVEIDTATGDIQYTTTEFPSIAAQGPDWEIIRSQTDTHFELWHVQADGTETHILSTDLMPVIYKWRDGYYLLIVSDVVLTTTDLYRVAPHGLELKHLYHSDDLFRGINYFSMDDRDFYFAEAVAYNPRVYKLSRLSLDGTVQTYSQWRETNRFYGWTDIFVRDWSITKWLFGIVTTFGLLIVSLFAKRWMIVA